MSIILAVILVWTTVGCAVALWLDVVGWRPSNREALIACALCGPGTWLFVASCVAAALLSIVRSR